jgi:hypothetical protein
MSLGHSPSMVTNGLALYLDAGNVKSYPKSGATWTDISGNNRNATITNAVYNSANGGSIDFDGTGDYAIIDNCLPLKWQNITQVTLDITFKSIGRYVGNTRQYVFDARQTNGTPVYCWYLLIIDNNSYIVESTGNNTSGSYTDWNINTPTTLLNNTWNVVQTIDKTITTNNYKTYINGILVDTRSFNYSVTQGVDNTNQMYLGTYWGGADAGSNFHFAGSIYNVRIYNRALSAAEVTQNFNALRGRYGL